MSAFPIGGCPILGLAVPEARATWTDERLDDLSRRVDDGFKRIDARFDAFDARLDVRFDALDARFDARLDSSDARTNKRLEGIDHRFDSLQRTILPLGGGMIATMVVGFAGLIATGH